MKNQNQFEESVTKVARQHAQLKLAGEVRFVKDRSGDKGEWGWNTTGPSERQINTDFVFNARYLKPLAKVLRSCLMALGHATSAHTRFVKVKSRNVSPDGALGGKGYIQKIPDMRRQLMNCVEVLSAITDTIHDELHADHWDPAEDKLDARDREEVKEIVEEAEEIRDDPEAWADEEEEESVGKTANPLRVLQRYAKKKVELTTEGLTQKDLRNADIKTMMYRGKPIFRGHGFVLESQAERHLPPGESQESYFGYSPKKDLFVMGFDVWAEYHLDTESDVPDTVFEGWAVEIDGSGKVREAYPVGGPDGLYPTGVKELHRRFSDLLDLRLD